MNSSPENGKREQITYKQKLSRSDIYRYIKAVILPVGIFCLYLVAIQSLAGFGSNLVAPMTALMICVGLVCAIWLPSRRSSILTETYTTVGIYLVSLLALKYLVSLLSGVSSEMLMDAFDQALPVTSGSAISGWLQTLMWITAVMTPFGFIGLEAKRLFTFKRKNSKERFLEQTRGIHNDGSGHQ